MILEFESLVTCGKGFRHPTMPVLAIKNKLLALAFEDLKELGFEVRFGKGTWPS